MGDGQRATPAPDGAWERLAQEIALSGMLFGRAQFFRSALERYGRHEPQCPRWVTSGSPELNPCECGLDALLAEGVTTAAVRALAREAEPDADRKNVDGEGA